MAHRSDADLIAHSRNTARFFTETRHISWVLLVGTVLWGAFGFLMMPQRKDPDIPVRLAVALCPWPGASAQRVEELVTRRIEEVMAQNAMVERVTSVSRAGLSVAYVQLDERVVETGKQLDDIKMKLDGILDLPEGAGPINFLKDFGDTAALMLTVTSPKVGDVEIALRARDVRQAIEATRSRAPGEIGGRVSVIACVPRSISARVLERPIGLLVRDATEAGFARDVRPIIGSGFIGIDAVVDHDDAAILAYIDRFVQERLHSSEFHPDTWAPAVIRDPGDTRARLAAVAGEKYSYRELDDFVDLIKRTLHTVPQVSKIDLSGVLNEKIYLEYSQERLASYGVQTGRLGEILSARNITTPGGVMEIGGKNLSIDPSGEFKSEKEIGDVLIATSGGGAPVYLRDLVDVIRSYDSPASFLNYYSVKDAAGRWQRTRAITLAVQMRPGQQIAQFGAAVDAALSDLRARLPEDLIIARTSDQPRQVVESVDLFMQSLYEAIALVVLVALVGFWEWRTALLMALSIPLTLAMTFGMMDALGIDIQQVSVASLIIALGLLVDDPVVAGDAIKRELAAGHPPLVAAWLGPEKLATAILFATITNIVAYLPLLTISGDTGRFLYSMPVVLACSLIASRIVSMTFIPLLGYYLLRPGKTREASVAERRARGFARFYYRVGGWALDHRWKVFALSVLFLLAGGFMASQLKQSFFPKDLSYLSYIDVWLPEDAPLSATNAAARLADETAREVASEYGRSHPGADGRPRDVLKSLTTFVGGGGPRFWNSISPELQQLNYAQVILEVNDKHDTGHLVPSLQRALWAAIPGARVDVRELETAAAIGVPVAIRISGQEISALRAYAEKAKGIFRSLPTTERIRDNWGAENLVVKLQVDSDRANLAGISNQDIAGSSVVGMSGYQLTVLREGNKQIPVVARLRLEERARLSDVQSLYVYSSQGTQKVPLKQVSSIAYDLETAYIHRRNHFRTITVSCFPIEGVLASEVMGAVRPRLLELEKSLPPGYKMEVGGEEEEQKKGFKSMAIAMGTSVGLIFLALVLQFRNAVKPFIVFAAIPYGMVGAFLALYLMRTPFGFMAFLGIASLVGVIVSHVIVLFDFIEESHARGAPLREALLDAGIVRLRPVLITVGATVFGLFPLALHGGPLWEPLCYTQIGGLTLATVVTLLMVPVLYAICVLDLTIVAWEGVKHDG
ncbi:MAG TPA: efflux RND transporter permease subunit [Candidatus Polarisedimenticolia bacterium]|nr:efflux RND transporter permease subunit [Candidatus Polarisedimenticolia bacterium]